MTRVAGDGNTHTQTHTHENEAKADMHRRMEFCKQRKVANTAADGPTGRVDHVTSGRLGYLCDGVCPEGCRYTGGVSAG